MRIEKQTAAGWVLGIVFGQVAVGLLGLALWFTSGNLWVLASFRAAEGEVVQAYRVGPANVRHPDHRIEVHYRACPEPPPLPAGTDPFAAYSRPLGRLASDPSSACVPGERGLRRTQARVFGPSLLEVGDAVTVYWHPDHPREVHVATFSTFWFVPGVLWLVGGMFGYGVWRVWRDGRAARGSRQSN